MKFTSGDGIVVYQGLLREAGIPNEHGSLGRLAARLGVSQVMASHIKGGRISPDKAAAYFASLGDRSKTNLLDAARVEYEGAVRRAFGLEVEVDEQPTVEDVAVDLAEVVVRLAEEQRRLRRVLRSALGAATKTCRLHMPGDDGPRAVTLARELAEQLEACVDDLLGGDDA